MDLRALRIRCDQQELDQRQRVAVMLAHHAIGKVAELLRRQVPQVLVTGVHVFPDPVLQLPDRAGIDGPVDLQDGLVRVFSLLNAESRARLAQNALQVQARQRGPLDDPHAQVLVAGPAPLRPAETDDEVRETALRRDVSGHVRFPCRDLRADLFRGVAALGHVPLHLPLVLELGLRVKPDVEVEQAPQARHEEGMQSLDDDHLSRLDLLRRPEGAIGVVVNRLHDRIPALEREQLVLHQGEVVGTGIQRRDPDQVAFPPVQPVVIVQAHAGDLIAREDPVEPRRQRRLAAAAVAANGDEDRSLHRVSGCATHHGLPRSSGSIPAWI